MDQVCFSGETLCSQFKCHLLKANICTDCSKDITKHLKNAVKEEDLAKALEFTQKGELIPSLILERSENTGAVYLGGFKAIVNRRFIKDAGVTGVVNVVGVGLFKLYGKKFVDTYKKAAAECHLVIKTYDWEDDLKYDISEEDIIGGINFIEEQRSQGGSVVVHCAQGKSRSATLVVAYLMAKLRMSFVDALAHVKSKRKMADPNPHFQKMLQKFQTSKSLEELRKRFSSGLS